MIDVFIAFIFGGFIGALVGWRQGWIAAEIVSASKPPHSENTP